jgi:hypothetical protein
MRPGNHSRICPRLDRFLKIIARPGHIFVGDRRFGQNEQSPALIAHFLLQGLLG